jgi:SAM-dependent methyltransferase
MSDFEKKYYESSSFWENENLNDINNRKRVDETISFIPSEVSTVLDMGCGNGRFLAKLMEIRSNLKVVGLDRSKEALQHCNFPTVCSDFNKSNLKSNSFDLVTCLEVLEHLPVDIYSSSLSEMSRLSSNYILISVPYKENRFITKTTCPQCKCSFNRDLHLRDFNDEALVNLFSKHGFKLVSKDTVVKSKVLLGYFLYYNLLTFFKSRKVFQSPICILCGHENSKFENFNNTPVIQVRKGVVRSFLKLFWPKVNYHGYWVIALYKKI